MVRVGAYRMVGGRVGAGFLQGASGITAVDVQAYVFGVVMIFSERSLLMDTLVAA